MQIIEILVVFDENYRNLLQGHISTHSKLIKIREKNSQFFFVKV